jgi:hypothetical protein
MGMSMNDFGRLKRLYTRRDFGPVFIEAAKEDLPWLLGRLELLEEFYRLNRPGFSDRSRVLADQLEAHPVQMVRIGLLGRIERLIANLLGGERAAQKG